MTDRDFDAALATFVEGCQRIHSDHMTKNFPTLRPDVITAKAGKRYVKVIRSREDGTSTSVHCFVDQNGDVLKAASWRAPAKHARGNIFDDHNGLRHMNEYGPAYLR